MADRRDRDIVAMGWDTIDHAAHALAAFIRDTFGDQPVHLLAHSLGG